MKLNKKIISQIWDGCEKQIVDGYVFIKMDDLIKLEIEENNLEVKDNDVTMDTGANYLVNEGWIFERNPSTGEIWKRKPGDMHNRKLIN